MTMTYDESTFLGICFELMVYGFYTFLFITAFMYLTWWRKTESVHKFYLFFCCLLFSCCTVHVFIKFRYLYKDLILKPKGMIEAGTPALRVSDAFLTIIDFFAEIVLIYRLWAIWNRNYYIIILPSLVAMATVACGMPIIAWLSTHPDDPVLPPSLVAFGIGAFAIPLGFNFMVTGLIIGRIWYLWRQRHMDLIRCGAAIVSPNYLKETMAIIIESGLLYLVVQLILMILVALHHPAQILVSDIATQVYGIAPTLIFVRVGLGNAIRSSDYNYGSSARALNSSETSGRFITSDLSSPRSVTEPKRGMTSPIMYTTTRNTFKDPMPWEYEVHDIHPMGSGV